ncbi:GNAT family N-acetyltransferase [Streptomyces marianii]|uniref:GNAT family N-acetyltransferase n=1 Tax=Streptomyces marianii TaxID=1817406 RepID=A0A5R9DZK4_9ACTN|nr:GNAT family N-acetyltransferase [Streptomyces marianii]TLQ43101.1 GNAT family N-acetyltransferase [Streptomyces marianii]
MPKILIRRAAEQDLPRLVGLLAADRLGAARETPQELDPYRKAFTAINTSPHQILAVAETTGVVVGTVQLSFLQGLAWRGSLRALTEALYVHPDHRGIGIGTTMMGWTIRQARARGCAIMELTSHQSRTDAHDFYTRLGFTHSHAGFKLFLHDTPQTP